MALIRRRSMKRLLLCAAALAALAGCGDTVHGIEYAEPAVEKFRHQMQAGQFESAYESTGAEFRQATSRENGIALFAAVDRKLGKLQHAEKISWNVNTRNTTTFVVLVYNCKYAEGDATETFTVEVDDGVGVIVGYNIQSLAMMIK
jgi:Cys-tRNA synthase (O-phospho-L-seryl-tRNA:Cys-tRNA synthase)